MSLSMDAQSQSCLKPGLMIGLKIGVTHPGDIFNLEKVRFEPVLLEVGFEDWFEDWNTTHLINLQSSNHTISKSLTLGSSESKQFKVRSSESK